VLEFQSENIRNITFIGHGDSGKSSLSESILYATKETKRIGTINEGNTVSDYNEDEIERKYSINTSFMHCIRNENKINILDTPGYVDFTGEVKSSLHVADTAIVVISSLSGLEVGTEMTWGYCKKSNKPRIILINKLDKETSKFDDTLDIIKKGFGDGVKQIQFPVNEGLKFDSIVDVLEMKLLKFSGDKSGNFEKIDIPSEFQGKADELRNEILESIAETSEELLDKYLEDGTLNDEDISAGIKQGITDGSFFPVLCASAEKNAGTTSLIDFVVKYCPKPTDVKNITVRKEKDESKVDLKISSGAPISLQVFKTISEPHVGELSFFKCFTGSVRSGMDVFNVNRKKSERFGQVFVLNGHSRKEVASINAGDLGVVVKLKDTHTGDSLCDKGNQFTFPDIDFPRSRIRIAVKPVKKGEEEKVASGLSRLHEEDPSFKITLDPELHQTIISGQGELHLDVVIKRLKNKLGVEVEKEDPKIPYRETIKKSVKMQGKYKKQSGGKGQYGDTWIEMSPQPRGAGFEFVNKIVGGVIPTKFIPAVEKGIKETLITGVIAGCKVVDVKVALYDGSFHAVDSSDMSFKIAGSMAFKKAFLECGPTLLEPIYEVEVTVPEEFMGDVMGDLSSRRGKIIGTNAEGTFQIIKANVPLAELNKYSTSLRSMTAGRGIHNRKFYQYEEMPRDNFNKVIEAYKEARESHD